MILSRRVQGLLVAICLVVPLVVHAQLGGQFEYPVSVAVDFSGNVLVSENARNRIGFFGPNGAVGWRTGTLGSGDGEFRNPTGIATDSLGFVYVADAGNARIQKFLASSGAFVTKWGTAGSAPGQFRKPRAIAVDAGNNVWVLDAESMLVQKFSSDGTTLLGSFGGRTGTGDGELSALAGGPSDLAVDAAGFAYISDTANQRIQRWRVISTPTGMIQSATFVGWLGRCTSGANCDVANERSNGFQCTAATCSPASAGANPGQFVNPGGLAFDAASNLYVADTLNNRIQEFNTVGGPVRQFGTRGSLPGEFRTPVDISVSRTGELFVADFLNQRVQRFTSAGMFGAVFGGSIALSASVGYPPQALDALVDPNPMFVFAGQSVSTTVRVTSVNAFQGQVALSAPQCCEDLVTRAWTANPVTPTFTPAAVSVPQNGVVDATLAVSAPAAATPGHVLVPIAAGNPQLGVGAMAGVAVQVLTPVPADTGVVSPCIGGTVVGSVGGGSAGVGPEVLPLSSVTTGLYTTKVGSPAKTSFTIGAAAASQRSGWIIMIDKASRPLRPDQAVVILNNTTPWDKGISTVNSGNCVAASQNGRVSMGGSATILISMADTTTVLLNRQVCRFRFLFGCWDSSGWEQFAVFDEGPFWSLFGGRQVTINWFNSSGE